MSNSLEHNLLNIFEGPVKGGRGSGGKSLFNKAFRVVDRVPEVMVKITGNCKGSEHMKSHIEYISRNGKLEIETDQGEILRGKSDINAICNQWKGIQGLRNENTRDTTNIILSMPKGTQPVLVKDAVRAFAKHQFGQNYVSIL